MFFFLSVKKDPKLSKNYFFKAVNWRKHAPKGEIVFSFSQQLSTITNNFQAGFFFGGLLGEETGSERLFVFGRDEDAAFAVFGSGATVDAYAGASGDLLEDRQEALEAWRVRDGYPIDECRDEAVGVFECGADRMQAFRHQSGAFVEIMRDAVEVTMNGVSFGGVSYQFVISHSSQIKQIKQIFFQRC